MLRVCCTALPFLLWHVKNDTTNDNISSSIAIGQFLAHLGCSASILALGEDKITIILQRITCGLGNVHEIIDCYGMNEFATTSLAALVKFIALSSSDVVSTKCYITLNSISQRINFFIHFYYASNDVSKVIQ